MRGRRREEGGEEKGRVCPPPWGEDNEKESVVFIGRERGQRMRGKY
jgi:hypothetical protein